MGAGLRVGPFQSMLGNLFFSGVAVITFQVFINYFILNKTKSNDTLYIIVYLL